MTDTSKLLIGFDLCDDFSQIGYYDEKQFEPDTIKYSEQSNDDRIPTILAVLEEKKEWLVGEEAVMAIKLKKAVPVDDLLEHVKNNEKYVIFEKEFEPAYVLSKFFSKTLVLTRKLFPNDNIHQLVVTVKETNEKLVNGIFEALEMLGIGKDRASVISHAQSYTYYALSQKKELWMNDVAMFDFGEDGLMYYQIKIDRQKRPITVSINKTDYSEKLSMDLLNIMYEEQLAYIFDNIAREALYKQIISTIYVTGMGFSKGWADESVKKLCVGRRGFIGQNLFSGGACYAAKNMTGEDRFKDFMFLSEDMIIGTVSVKSNVDGNPTDIIFAKMATPWYEAESVYEFILDEVEEIELTVKNEIKNTKTNFFIVLEGIPKRPERTTRIRMKIKFLSPKTFVVSIKDLGFGKLFPATDRVWEKVYNI